MNTRQKMILSFKKTNKVVDWELLHREAPPDPYSELEGMTAAQMQEQVLVLKKELGWQRAGDEAVVWWFETIAKGDVRTDLLMLRELYFGFSPRATLFEFWEAGRNYIPDKNSNLALLYLFQFHRLAGRFATFVDAPVARHT